MVIHPLEKCIKLKEHIMRLIKDGRTTLDLDDVVETYHISCQTTGLSIIQFRSLGPFALYEHGLPNPTTHEVFFPDSIFDRLPISMTLCFEVEEEADKEDSK